MKKRQFTTDRRAEKGAIGRKQKPVVKDCATLYATQQQWSSVIKLTPHLARGKNIDQQKHQLIIRGKLAGDKAARTKYGTVAETRTLHLA